MAAEWRRKRERRRHFKEKMSLEEAHHHRRLWIRAWRKKEMNEGRGRERFERINLLIYRAFVYAYNNFFLD